MNINIPTEKARELARNLAPVIIGAVKDATNIASAAIGAGVSTAKFEINKIKIRNNENRRKNKKDWIYHI